MNNEKNKIIVVLGPTASGKTKLAVELAVKFNGEIVSADSRQVYKGMNIGTGKDLNEYTVPYHLIDVASPKIRFDLAKYQNLAFQAIDDILKRGQVPILAGGSGLYLQAVVDNYKLSEAKKDLSSRKKMEKLSAVELFLKLKKLSPKMAAKLNQSDRNNKRRLIRYLEILGLKIVAVANISSGSHKIAIISQCPEPKCRKILGVVTGDTEPIPYRADSVVLTSEIEKRIPQITCQNCLEHPSHGWISLDITGQQPQISITA